MPLLSHPAVAEAAVVGKPDVEKGEAIILFVTLKAGTSPSSSLRQELVQHLRRVIGPIATPAEVYFVGSLPKTRSGKIMRRLLRAWELGEPEGDISTLED